MPRPSGQDEQTTPRSTIKRPSSRIPSNVSKISFSGRVSAHNVDQLESAVGSQRSVSKGSAGSAGIPHRNASAGSVGSSASARRIESTNSADSAASSLYGAQKTSGSARTPNSPHTDKKDIKKATKKDGRRYGNAGRHLDDEEGEQQAELGQKKSIMHVAARGGPMKKAPAPVEIATGPSAVHIDVPPLGLDKMKDHSAAKSEAEDKEPDSPESYGSGPDAEKRRKAKEKLKKPKLTRRERIKAGLSSCKYWCRWIVKRTWEEATCHYRKRQDILLKNGWLDLEFEDRDLRTNNIRMKRRINYEEQVNNLEKKRDNKEMRKCKAGFILFTLKLSYLWFDIKKCLEHAFGYVHKGTGLPRSLMEWWWFNMLLHEGTHGRVYEATDIKGRKVIVKIRDKSRGVMLKMPLGRAQSTLRREVTSRRFKLIRRFLAHWGLAKKPFQHDHVVRVDAVFDNAEFFVEVSEMMDGGSLYRYIEEIELDEHSVCSTFTRILIAISYLHERKLMHRDLRLPQMLLGRDRGKPDLKQVKLSDFWFAARAPKRGQHLVDPEMPGDIATRAPEVILRGEWSTKADIWSAGCVLFEMLFGHPPFGGSGEALVYRICYQGPEFDVLCGSISDGAMDLLRQMLRRNPTTRPSAKTLLEHRWFKDYGGDRKRQIPAAVNQRPHRDRKQRRIKKVAIYGKDPPSRRGMDAHNLLSAKTGMFNSGFCTPMGLTRCSIDLIIGDPNDDSTEPKQYWVKDIMVSLWATADNPRKISAYGAQRPGCPWVPLAETNVESLCSTQARLVIDKPLRLLRVSFSGNFGGVYGIALQKLTLYGFDIRQEPISFMLPNCVYARGAGPHTHTDVLKEADTLELPKLVRAALERGARIPGTGQRYFVYRDILSGMPHSTTVAQMYTMLKKGNTIVAATLSLRYAAYYPTLSNPPRCRIATDAEEGKTTMFVTHDLPATEWPAEEVVNQGYSDLETLWVTDLHISTDNGFVIELHFENNSGYAHVPSDFGLTLYYVPEAAEHSDDSDEDHAQSAALNKARYHRRIGVDMHAQGLHGHGHGHGGADHNIGDQLAAMKNDEEFTEKPESLLSESAEKVMKEDLDDLARQAQFGRWGAGDFCLADVKSWNPRSLTDISGRHSEKGALRNKASRKGTLSIEEYINDKWWEGHDSDQTLSTPSSASAEEEVLHRKTRRLDTAQSVGGESAATSVGSGETEELHRRSNRHDTDKSLAGRGDGSPREENEEDVRARLAAEALEAERLEAEKIEHQERLAELKKKGEQVRKELKQQLNERAKYRAAERKERLLQHLMHAEHHELEQERVGQWADVAEHWKDKGHRISAQPAGRGSTAARGSTLPMPVSAPGGTLAGGSPSPRPPNSARSGESPRLSARGGVSHRGSISGRSQRHSARLGHIPHHDVGSKAHKEHKAALSARRSQAHADAHAQLIQRTSVAIADDQNPTEGAPGSAAGSARSRGSIFGGGEREIDTSLRQKVEARIAKLEGRAMAEMNKGANDDMLACLCTTANRPFCSKAYEQLQTTLPTMLASFTPPVPPSTPRGGTQTPGSASISSTAGSGTSSMPPEMPKLNLTGSGASAGDAKGCSTM